MTSGGKQMFYIYSHCLSDIYTAKTYARTESHALIVNLPLKPESYLDIMYDDKTC